MRVFMLLMASVLLAGCAANPAIKQSSGTSSGTTVAMADAYGSAPNTSADVAAAKAAVEASLSAGLAQDVTPSMLQRAPRTLEEVPLDWFDSHTGKPFKVVALTAQSDVDRKRNPQWIHIFVVIQPTAGSRWMVWRTDEGV